MVYCTANSVSSIFSSAFTAGFLIAEYGGARVNVEVQIRNCRNMEKRSLFYWSRGFSRSLSAGQDYSELPDVIASNIVDFGKGDRHFFHP